MIDARLLRGVLLAVCIGWLGTTALSGQVNDLYQLRLDDATVSLGGTFDARVTLDSAGGSVEGWSFGICHDPAALDEIAVAPGLTTDTVKNGSPADFVQINEYPSGWTAGVVICLTACATLPPSIGNELFVATYQEVGGTAGTFDLCFCDTLGSPAVNTIVVVNAQSMVPETHCGVVEVIDTPPFRFRAESVFANYSPTDGTGSVTADLHVLENQANGTGQSTEAFAMGISHDPALLTATSVDTAGALAAINGGAGPDFFGPNLLANGITVGAVYSFLSTAVIQFGSEQAVARVQYDTVPGALIGNDVGMSTALGWSDLLGNPPVRNVMVVSGSSLTVELVDANVDLVPTVAIPFKRGDCNGDTAQNLADGIWLLNYLFLAGPSRECLAACDTDDDDTVGLLDAVLLIQHWITGGPPPAHPYPGCGIDADAFCPTYPGCP